MSFLYVKRIVAASVTTDVVTLSILHLTLKILNIVGQSDPRIILSLILNEQRTLVIDSLEFLQ
jgi:hypothetical protein